MCVCIVSYPAFKSNLTNAVLQLEPRTHTETGGLGLGDRQNQFGLLGDERVVLAEQLGHLGEEGHDLVH